MSKMLLKYTVSEYTVALQNISSPKRFNVSYPNAVFTWVHIHVLKKHCTEMYLVKNKLQLVIIKNHDGLCVCVCVCRMYRRTSNMAGLTYPPSVIAALKVHIIFTVDYNMDLVCFLKVFYLSPIHRKSSSFSGCW